MQFDRISRSVTSQEIDESLVNSEYRDIIREYAQIVYLYNAAIQFINVRLETLAAEFRVTHKVNPIHHIQSRIKTPNSIMRKLKMLNLPVSMTNAKKSLRDLAGVRIICCYVEDIYVIARLLESQDDIQLIEEKDYIKHPKPNGYRSLHVVVDVPVYLSDTKLFIPVEIQIRTVAMDFWASLEHGLRYKAQEEIPPFIVDELKSCAEIIAQTDARMEQISKVLSQLRDE